MTTTILTISNIVILITTLVFNKIGSSGGFNGMGQKEVSDKYKTLITPAGFAFAIWGVIYLFLSATIIYLFFQRSNPDLASLINMLSPLFILSSLFNIAWIVSFSYEKLALSTVFIFGILLSLMTIVKNLYTLDASFATTLSLITFTLYSAWVFIATILNVALFLVQIEWQAFNISKSKWTIAILFIAMALVLVYVLYYKNAIFPLPIAWAFFGIYSSYKKGIINPQMSKVIKNVLIFGIMFFILLTIATFTINNFQIFA